MQASISCLRTLVAIVAILGAGSANAQLFGSVKPAAPVAPAHAQVAAPVAPVAAVIHALPASVEKTVTVHPKPTLAARARKDVKAPVAKMAPKAKVASEASIKYLAAVSALLNKDPK